MARDPQTQRARHTWTDNDRVLLALLYRLYTNNKSEILPIWSLINREVLMAEGFRDGSMHITSLMTQRYDLKRTQHPVWDQVWKTPLQLLRRKYRIQKDRIENAAQALQIKLELRVEPAQTHHSGLIIEEDKQTSVTTNSTSTTDAGTVRRDAWSTSTEPENKFQHSQSAAERQTAVLNRRTIRSFMFHPSGARGTTSETESQELPGNMMPRLRNPAHSRSFFEAVVIPTSPSSSQQVNLPRTPAITDQLRNVRASPRLMSVFDSEGGHAKRHPVLLFRAYDPELGFTSRRFQNSEVIGVPPAVGSEAFKAEVVPHLFVRDDFDSPFISLTQFARYSLKIISTSEKPKHFAVFAYSDLEEEGLKRNKMKPRLVPKICADHDLNERLPNRYRGRGEFLTWGKIDSRPLLTLATGAALELFGTLKDIDECSPDAAAKLYPFLKDVDSEYREVVLRALVTSMKIDGHDWLYHSPRWEAFADVLFPEASLEKRSRHSESILSTISVQNTPSSSGEGYLVIDIADGEEEIIDIRANEEYGEIFSRSQTSPEVHYLAMGNSTQVDEPQGAADAQLLREMRAYVENEDMDTTQTTEPNEIDQAAMLETFMRNTAAKNTATNQPLTPSISSTSSWEIISNDVQVVPGPVPLDLHDDMVMQGLPNDGEDEQAQSNGDDFILLTPPMPRALSIRHRSRTVADEGTPSRASRWPDQHIIVLDD